MHDWRAAIFVPGVTLDRALAVSRHYGRYAATYDPIIRSGVVGHARQASRDVHRVYLRLEKGQTW